MLKREERIFGGKVENFTEPKEESEREVNDDIFIPYLLLLSAYSHAGFFYVSVEKSHEKSHEKSIEITMK